MTKKEKFDELLKNNSIEHSNFNYSEDSFGYDLDGKIYGNYIKESLFDDLVKNMKTIVCHNNLTAHEQYEKGGGNEIKKVTKENKNKLPKMASIASSSRFCYEALIKNGHYTPEFKVFNSMDSSHRSSPNLDAFYSNSEKEVFFEAKCHEIFDTQNNYFSENGYLEVLTDSNFGFGFTKSELGKTVINDSQKIYIKEFFSKFKNFDYVQFIRHVCGIASRNYETAKYIKITSMLDEKNIKEKYLVYLFFKPINFDQNSIYENLKSEINFILNHQKIHDFLKKFKIKVAFYVQNSYYFEPCTNKNTVPLIDSNQSSFDFDDPKTQI